MKIYLVYIEHQWYDTYDAHVVIADTPTQARYVASQSSADEWPEIWLNDSKVNLIWNSAKTYQYGKVVLSSFIIW